MAATKPLVFTGITIGGVAYDKHLAENAEITLEPTSTQVDDGQTKIDFYDVTFQCDLYNDTVLNDANVNKSASDDAKTTLVFTGVDGGQTITISSIMVNATKTFDGNRMAIRLTGSKRAVSIANAITTA